ncbi:helix-turn-helix domain-containing protein [Haloactinopolyspora sp.]|jgi:AraC-like DNA-binding protein|uniref:AraC family transcriptional regulator n=1 Tax=Haloactinopolyspora sp. TaxID=1966353 RepID=UPI00260DFE82|nr:helix-turn-helix domain-containing protein [Haloactinopolyspora sp.]
MQLTRHDGDTGWWEMARCLPHPALRRDVLGYTGYTEHTLQPVRRRELPGPRVSVIISFGPSIDVLSSGDGLLGRLTSFVAGCADRHAVTEYVGGQQGLQIEFTALGAFRLLGLTGDEIRDGVLDLADLFGHRRVQELTDRLVSAPDWPVRCSIMDHHVLELAEDARAVDDAIGWAWQRLVDSRGQTAVGGLAADMGWSRRHFIQRFQRQAGLSPKTAARVIRFDHAARQLARRQRISDVAAATGYADHSHLVRDFRAMAGCTPSQLLAEWGLDDAIPPGQL